MVVGYLHNGGNLSNYFLFFAIAWAIDTWMLFFNREPGWHPSTSQFSFREYLPLLLLCLIWLARCKLFFHVLHARVTNLCNSTTYRPATAVPLGTSSCLSHFCFIILSKRSHIVRDCTSGEAPVVPLGTSTDPWTGSLWQFHERAPKNSSFIIIIKSQLWAPKQYTVSYFLSVTLHSPLLWWYFSHTPGVGFDNKKRNIDKE